MTINEKKQESDQGREHITSSSEAPGSTKVVHCKREPYTVYIGRSTAGQPLRFGNPFKIGPDGDRDEVIAKHRQWLEGTAFTGFMQDERQWILDNLHTLEGQVLGCWCKPKHACHGDTYVALLNRCRTESDR